MSESPPHCYRAEIDGLRAIAILAVVFFHLGAHCPGGYIGVDIFFVISGYLITSLILRDLRLTNFSLVDFWQRRIRRIIPALSFSILTVLAAGWLLLLPSDYVALGKSAIAQAFMVANVYFWRGDNYFAAESQSEPLMHTWSLSVEEQFYLIFPFILIVFFRFPSLRTPRSILALLICGVMMSFALSIYGMKVKPQATFYLLPTRAWELGVGAIIAALPHASLPHGRRVREWSSWAGLLAIVMPIWLYDESTPFPGLAAIPPCLGAALIIWANSPVSAAPPINIVARVLSSKPFVLVGLISYSLYLWHWPVIVYWKYWKPETEPVTKLEMTGMFFIGLAFAVASWKFIEMPFRKKTLSRKTWRPVILPLCGLASTFIIGLVIFLNQGDLNRFSDKVIRFDQAVYDHRPAIQRNAEEIAQDLLPEIGHPADSPSRAIDILLWGDSHAMAAIPAFDEFCKRHQLVARYAVHAATAPTLSTDLNRDPSFSLTVEGQRAYGRELLKFIATRKVKSVFLVAHWERYEKDDAGKFKPALAETIAALKKLGVKVFVMRNVPSYPIKVPKQLAREEIFGATGDGWLTSISDHKNRNILIDQLAKENQQAIFLDPSISLENEKNQRYFVEIDGRPLYRDSNHLTITGAKSIILPMLDLISPEFLSKQSNGPFPH